MWTDRGPGDCRCTREHPCAHKVRHACHVDGHCPPCVELVSKPCWGGHTVLDHIRCHVAAISCGKPCAKALACGDHVCPELCHQGECEDKYTKVPERAVAKPGKKVADEWAPTKEEKAEAERAAAVSAAVAAASTGGPAGEDLDSWEDLVEDDGGSPDPAAASTAASGSDVHAAARPSADDGAAEAPPSCGLQCGKQQSCGHACPERCHPGQPCPGALCKVAVRVRCDCGRRTAIGECGSSRGRRVGGDSAAVDAAKSFTRMQLGASFSRQPAMLKPGTQLSCDAKCGQLLESAKKMERNRQVAAALGLTGADATDLVRDDYSEVLLKALLRKPQLVAFLERT
jgi:hypothetical protein